MPASRFFGYIEWINKPSIEANKSEHQKKVEQLKALEEDDINSNTEQE